MTEESAFEVCDRIQPSTERATKRDKTRRWNGDGSQVKSAICIPCLFKGSLVVDWPMACMRWYHLHHRRSRALVIEGSHLILGHLRVSHSFKVQARKEYPCDVTMLHSAQATIGNLVK